MDNDLIAEEKGPTVDEDSSLRTVESGTLSQIDGGVMASTSKPKKTRALVYQFFEWITEINQYECKLCKYVPNRLYPSNNFRS